MKILWRILGLGRDLVKELYRFCLQLVARLFYIEREWPSAISWSAVLDVIPRGPNERRNRLVVGKRCSVERWTAINTGSGDVFLGAYSGIGIGSIVIGPVRIGERTHIAQNCLISGQSHRYDDASVIISQQGFDVREVVIEDDAWVAANCVVLPGVRVGRHSVIGAGSVVTRDIPAFSLAVGNPAKVVKKYDQDKDEWIRV